MARPRNIPKRPYTIKQVFKRTWKHFIDEKNPKCMKEQNNGDKFCVYSGTGCGVGCHVTINVAKKWDTIESEKIISSIAKNDNENYRKFFGEDAKMLDFLSELQDLHDNIMKKADFTERMRYGLNELKEKYKIS